MDASGNSNSCQFTITVGSPFNACCVDDATGNTISIVADPASPLYGFWQFRVAATGQVLQGLAESVSYIPGHSLTAYDRDSPRVRMDIQINYGAGTCTATVLDYAAGGVRYVVRDRDITNNPPC
jgi:hypothetical protein